MTVLTAEALAAQLAEVPPDAEVFVYGGGDEIFIQAEWNSFAHPLFGADGVRVVARFPRPVTIGGRGEVPGPDAEVVPQSQATRSAQRHEVERAGR